MKNLKLLFLTLFSVLSLTVFSQTQVYTTQTSGPNICDGTAVLDTNNINMSSIYWQGMGMIINQGSYMIGNLCPGTYMVTFTPLNGNSVTLTFVISAGSFNPCLNFTGFTTPTNSVDSTTCDGIITTTVTGGTSPYTYLWSNGSTTFEIPYLCPGQYCCYVTDANGCNLTLCDTIGVQSSNFGDTLIISNAGTCNSPVATLFNSIEDCNLDYNAIDSAYINSVILPTNPLDSNIICLWNIVDTNGVSLVYTTLFPNVLTTGCYNFQLTLYCYQKSMNYKTVIVNDSYYIGFSNINELSMNQRKLIKVIDLMGRTTQLEPNRLLIKCYNDGTTEKVFITE
jgi:hypothetical protein